MHYANTVATCDQQFQECKKKAKRQALKGGFIVFAATGLTFDLGIVGCVGTGPAAAPCILALEELQTAITPILLAPFGEITSVIWRTVGTRKPNVSLSSAKSETARGLLATRVSQSNECVCTSLVSILFEPWRSYGLLE